MSRGDLSLLLHAEIGRFKPAFATFSYIGFREILVLNTLHAPYSHLNDRCDIRDGFLSQESLI